MDNITEPETFRIKFPLLSDTQFDEVMAGYIVENTNIAFENYRYFTIITLALNGINPSFTCTEIPDVEHIWYALDMMEKLRPHMELSYEVQQFIKAVSNEQGYYVYPPQCKDIFPSRYQKKAEELCDAPGTLQDTTPEEIQATKLLVLRHYLNRMKT